MLCLMSLIIALSFQYLHTLLMEFLLLLAFQCDKMCFCKHYSLQAFSFISDYLFCRLLVQRTAWLTFSFFSMVFLKNACFKRTNYCCSDHVNIGRALKSLLEEKGLKGVVACLGLLDFFVCFALYIHQPHYVQIVDKLI